LYLSLVVIDLLCLALGFALANLLRFGILSDNQGRDMFIIVWPIFAAVAFNHGAYGLDALRSPKLGILRAVRALALACVVVIGILFYLKISSSFSRQVFGTGAAAGATFILLTRWFFGQKNGRRYKWQFTNEILLVDGMSAFPRGGEIVLVADELKLSPDSNDAWLLDRVGRLLKNSDRVVLATSPEKRAAWVLLLKGLGTDVEVLAPELDRIGALALRSYEGESTLLVGSRPLGLRDKLVKRCLDLVVTVPVLIVLAPFIAIIALAIKLDSPGPVFFRQLRVGEGNRMFMILKFRSMKVGDSDQTGHRSTSRNDSRVTRVGGFLRRLSLDELPQLFNVLRNDMSIVGPRPHALASTAEDTLFWNIDDRYWQRHGIKPGITGLAQVRGYRGATATHGDVTARVQSDLEYLVDWSLVRDLTIMFQTIRVLTHRNAF